METNIFYMRNAALYFETTKRGVCIEEMNGSEEPIRPENRLKTGILVDGIHNGCEVGMSMMDERTEKEMEVHAGIFATVKGLLFTHLHEDHYCPEKTEVFLSNAESDIAVYGPFLKASNVCLEPLGAELSRFWVEPWEIIVKRTVHDGEGYRKDPHVSFLIGMESEYFFVAGDAALQPEDADDFLPYTSSVEAAFVNLYQLVEDSGIAFLHRLKPKRVVLYHLPVTENDVWNYLRLARQAVRRAQKHGIHVKCEEHMSWMF